MSSATPTGLFQRVLTLRIIHAAMLLGCLAFLGSTYYQRSQEPAEQEATKKQSHLTGLMLGIAVAGVMGSFLLPFFMAQSARWELTKGTPTGPDDPKATGGDDDHWLSKYVAIFLVRLALIEGGALGLTMAFLIDGSWVAFGGAVVLVLLILLQFPRANVVREWVEMQRAQVLAARQPADAEDKENPLWPDI
jgi:hypothetical protein